MSSSSVGLNFGVLFAWIGVSLITIPLFQWYARRQAVKAWERNQADALSDTTQEGTGTNNDME